MRPLQSFAAVPGQEQAVLTHDAVDPLVVYARLPGERKTTIQEHENAAVAVSLALVQNVADQPEQGVILLLAVPARSCRGLASLALGKARAGYAQGLRYPGHRKSSSKGNGVREMSFFARDVQCFLEDLDFHRLLAQKALKIPDALLQRPGLGSTHNPLVRLYRNLAAFAHEFPPPEE